MLLEVMLTWKLLNILVVSSCQVTDQTTTAETLIGNLCINTFSGVAISSLVDYKMGGDGTKVETIPVLNVILHPFKEIRSTSFKEGEKLFGIIVDSHDPKKEVKTIEFLKPLETFSSFSDKKDKGDQQTMEALTFGKKTEDEKEGIETPTFQDFFDDNFLKENPKAEYKPLNNATEIAPYNKETDLDEQDGTFPNPIYIPCKVIPITPIIASIIWEQREENFDGIINGIREHAWTKVKDLSNIQSRKAYLFLIYRTIQAFWVHGQREGIANDSAIAKFVHSGPEKVAKLTESRWAIDKTLSITESLALNLGNLKIHFSSNENHEQRMTDDQPAEDEDNNEQATGQESPTKGQFPGQQRNQGHNGPLIGSQGHSCNIGKQERRPGIGSQREFMGLQGCETRLGKELVRSTENNFARTHGSG
jgi:hypothetical protein